MVSVLVRSIDRAPLQEALASIALQTWPNIEVVVIAAQPGHGPLPERCGPHPLRLVTTDARLARSKAANRALDEARGEFLLFLDDDDWLMPGHLERLAKVLNSQPKALAAYTGVSLVAGDGRPLGQAMDLPYDGVRQLAGNMTPIHSVMFSRRLLELGVRFDEALDHYEDWDFWLQVARHTVLVHLPGVSAAYRIHDSSGVHDDPGPAGAASRQIYEKWQALWSQGDRVAMMKHVWSAADFEHLLAAADEALASLRGVVAQQQSLMAQQHATIAQQASTLAQQQVAAGQQQAHLQTTIAQQGATLQEQSHTISHLHLQAEGLRATIAARESNIADFTNSTSWKLTAPLRWVSRAIRRRA